jgi:hypothetical protein
MAVTDGLFSGASIGEVRQLLNKERDDRIRQAQLDNFAMTQNPYAAMIAKSNQQLAEAVTGGARALGQATGLDTGMFAGLGQDARLTKAVERDALRTEVMDMAKTADLSNPEDVTKIANLLMQRGQPELATQFMAQARLAAGEKRDQSAEGRAISAADRAEKLSEINLELKKLQKDEAILQNKIDKNPKSGKAAQAQLELEVLQARIGLLKAQEKYNLGEGRQPAAKAAKSPTTGDKDEYKRAVKEGSPVYKLLEAEARKRVKEEDPNFSKLPFYTDLVMEDIDELILEFGPRAKELQEEKNMRPDEAIKQAIREKLGGTASKSGGGRNMDRVPTTTRVKSQRVAKGNQ